MSFQGVDPIVLAVFVGALSLMPMLLIVCTAFLKIVIVLMITRNAIGVQQVPPSMAINGIALAATLFIMAPVGYEIAEVVKVSPLDLSNVSTLQQTGLEAVQPLRTFMVRNSDPDILTHLLENTARMWPPAMAQEVQREDLILLIPAYVLSQLQAGFEIGFLIYIPFIVIDLIVSNLLLALGMQMVSPMTISLPLKLLLFVMVSGWSRLPGTACSFPISELPMEPIVLFKQGMLAGGGADGAAADCRGDRGRPDVTDPGADADTRPDAPFWRQAGRRWRHVGGDRALDWPGVGPVDQPDVRHDRPFGLELRRAHAALS